MLEGDESEAVKSMDWWVLSKGENPLNVLSSGRGEVCVQSEQEKEERQESDTRPKKHCDIHVHVHSLVKFKKNSIMIQISSNLVSTIYNIRTCTYMYVHVSKKIIKKENSLLLIFV